MAVLFTRAFALRPLPLLIALTLLSAAILAACDPATPPAAPAAPPSQPTVDEILALDQAQSAGVATPAPEVDAAPQPDPAQEEPPEPAEAAVEALVFVEPRQVRQGASFLVVVDSPNAGAASVAFEGAFLSFIREGGRLFTILPVDAEAPPGPLSLLISIADGEGRPALTVELEIEVLPANWTVEVVEIDDENSRLLDPEVIAEDLAVRSGVQFSKSPVRLWSGFFRPPTAGVITSTFGVRRSYNFAEPVDYHTGMDHAGALGELVVAPNDGVVAWTGETERRGRGVIIDHGGGLFTTYWHLSSVSAEEGNPISRGDVLGRIGNTGLSTGPHLHWEVVVHGVAVDPIQWIREQEVPDPSAQFDPGQAIYRTEEPVDDTPTGAAADSG